MLHVDQRCVESIALLFRDLEPSIPGLPERMAVRMLRSVLENNIDEVRMMDRSVQWDVFVRVFLSMRAAVYGLSVAFADAGAASRLYAAIHEGLRTVNGDGSVQGEAELFERCSSDVGIVTFVLELYAGVIGGLTELARDARFMESMGPMGPSVFADIIGSLEAVQTEGEKIIVLMGSHSAA